MPGSKVHLTTIRLPLALHKRLRSVQLDVRMSFNALVMSYLEEGVRRTEACLQQQGALIAEISGLMSQGLTPEELEAAKRTAALKLDHKLGEVA